MRGRTEDSMVELPDAMGSVEEGDDSVGAGARDEEAEAVEVSTPPRAGKVGATKVAEGVEIVEGSTSKSVSEEGGRKGRRWEKTHN